MSEFAPLFDAGIVGASVAISVAIIKVMDYLSSKKRNENGHSKTICIKEQILQRVEESTVHAHERLDKFQGHCADQHLALERELGGMNASISAIGSDVRYLREKADK